MMYNNSIKMKIMIGNINNNYNNYDNIVIMVLIKMFITYKNSSKYIKRNKIFKSQKKN